MAGTAMGRRLLTCTGYYYPVMPGKYRDLVGNNQFPGKSMLVRPTDEIETTGERRVIDGLEMEFMFVPEAEAPVEMMICSRNTRLLCCRRNYAYDA
ncbi:MAG: hypothetical protein ACLUDU_00655 [Butyricimonas faecihominis]